MRWALILFLVLPWLFLAYTVRWARLRYGRGGPFPFSERWQLHVPVRPLIHPVSQTLRECHVRPATTVLELGPGDGYFSPEAARIIGPQGRLICVDLQTEMVIALRERLSSSGVHADPVVGEAGSLPLADRCVDCAFLVTVLGEIPDRVRAMRELRRVLAPGGVLSITESLPDPDYQFMASVRDLARATGFEEFEEIRRLGGFTLNFRRLLEQPTSEA